MTIVFCFCLQVDDLIGRTGHLNINDNSSLIGQSYGSYRQGLHPSSQALVQTQLSHGAQWKLSDRPSAGSIGNLNERAGPIALQVNF